jgi:hypothetical protein
MAEKYFTHEKDENTSGLWSILRPYFREFVYDELPRIPIPRSLVNKGKEKDRGC